jgi:hypothetical protein
VTAPQPPQFDEPFTETRAQTVQALAVLATVSEAAARWAAVGVQHRASNAERTRGADQAAAHAKREADRLADASRNEQARADRAHIALAFDDQWLENADLRQTAALWRVATMHAAGGDEWARAAMANAEQRLAHLKPNLMEYYRRFRAEGHLPAEAMRAAAYGSWMHVDNANLGPQARPHPGPQPDALRPGANGRAIGPGGQRLDDLDAAVRDEIARLAGDVDPTLLDQLQRQLRTQGLIPPAEAAELLAEHARHLLHTAAHSGPAASRATIRRGHARPAAERPGTVEYDTIDVPIRGGDAGLAIAGRHADDLAQQANADTAAAQHLDGLARQEYQRGSSAYGTPDLTATDTNEHTAGLAAGHVADGRAHHDQAGAEQRRRMGQTFPELTVVQQAHPDLATRQAATIIPAQQRGRGR